MYQYVSKSRSLLQVNFRVFIFGSLVSPRREECQDDRETLAVQGPGVLVGQTWPLCQQLLLQGLLHKKGRAIVGK